MHIERDLFKIAAGHVDGKEVIILLGPRQVGKSYILKWLKNTIEKGRIQTAFFDLENPGTLLQFNQPDTEVFKLLTRSGRVVFIDEFQTHQSYLKQYMTAVTGSKYLLPDHHLLKSTGI